MTTPTTTRPFTFCPICRGNGHDHLRISGCLLADCPCAIYAAVAHNRAAWVLREQQLAANRARRNQRLAARSTS